MANGEKPPYIINSNELSLRDVAAICDVLRVDHELAGFAIRQLSALERQESGWLPLGTIAASEQVSPSTARRRLKHLAEAGAMVEKRQLMEVSPAVYRRVLIFEYNTPESKTIRERLEKECAAAQRLEEKRSVPHINPKEIPTDLHREDSISLYVNMIWSLIFPVLSYSRCDKTKSRTTTISSDFSPPFPVSATSKEGTPIARVTDLVCWAALLSVCRDDLRERRAQGIELTNTFTIRAFPLARKLNIGRIDTLSGVLERLNNTELNLTLVPRDIVINGWAFDELIVNTSFLHELAFAVIGDLSDSDSERRKPGTWAFQWQLPHYVYEMLISKLDGTRVRPIPISQDLLEEPNNVIAGLHLYSRRALQRIDKHEDLTLHELQARIAPNMKPYEFFRRLGGGIASLYQRERERIDNGAPLRVITGSEMEIHPYDPIPPAGFGENPVSQYLPREADVECYGFQVSIENNRIHLMRNPSDTVVGSFSESERHALKQDGSEDIAG